MNAEIESQLASINGNIDNIDQSYSGGVGCMCGCQGTYSNDPTVVKRAFNRLINNPNVKVDVKNKCIYVETATRNNVVWFK